MMYQAGLILEGGGMKGAYTSGVLDFFLDKEIEFEKVYGVSAGACNMCSYLSKQRGRAFAVTVDYLQDKNYCSAYSLVKTGDLFGADMCYRKIPEELNPYDYEEFERYPGKAYAVVTNIETGRPEYIQIKDMHRDIEAVRASASLPIVSRNVSFRGSLYLDGGIVDGIPIKRSILGGTEKNVVVMTKEIGYRREPSSMLSVIKMKYRKYPKVYELMKNRHLIYNDTLDFMEWQEKLGRVFVIRPSRSSTVGRIEKDKEKLRVLYRMGYKDAANSYDALQDYLQK